MTWRPGFPLRSMTVPPTRTRVSFGVNPFFRMASRTCSHSVSHRFSGRSGWLHVAAGTAEVNGMSLKAGDGVAISDEEQISISSKDRGEVLLFEFGA